jgi:hypothetical protein
MWADANVEAMPLYLDDSGDWGDTPINVWKTKTFGNARQSTIQRLKSPARW